MSYRSATLYVSPRTAKLLRLVTKLYPARSDTAPEAAINMGDKNQTPDEVADILLRNVIGESYPLAVELAKKQDALEREYQDKVKQ